MVKYNNNEANIITINHGLYIKQIMPSVQLMYNKTGLFIVVSKKEILTLCRILYYHGNFQYKMLIDICVVDYPGKHFRFELNYILLSIAYNNRINVVTYLEENEPIDSLMPIFKGANWLEREVWDMFGIIFNEHEDLRRILTDYGFKGHPLRKDFPLSGFLEIIYDDFNKKLTAQEVSLPQSYRNFLIF